MLYAKVRELLTVFTSLLAQRDSKVAGLEALVAELKASLVASSDVIETLRNDAEETHTALADALESFLPSDDTVVEGNPTEGVDGFVQAVIESDSVATPEVVASAETIGTSEPTSPEVVEAAVDAVAEAMAEPMAEPETQAA